MFNPMPSDTVDTGMYASSRAPAKYNGVRGPGTFEITTFTGEPTLSDNRSRDTNRSAEAATTGDA